MSIAPVQPARIESPYMTVDETIVYLRLTSRRALQRLLSGHRLPHGRLGRKLLFDRREVDAWVLGYGSALEMARTRKAS